MRLVFLGPGSAARVIAVISILLTHESWACEKLQTPNDLLSCVKTLHADIQVEKQGLVAAERGVDAASQLKNPELELESIPQTGGWANDAKLLVPIELGGKRSSRKALAEADVALARAGLLRTQESTIIQAVLDLYRLRQTTRELEIARETHETFQGITANYSRAGRLNPEQEVSLSVFRLASDESSLRMISLKSERERLIASLESALARKLPTEFSALLPKSKTDWPEIVPAPLAGSSISTLGASVERARATFELESAQAWPDLHVGPAFQTSSAPGGESKVGAGLTFDLPVLSLNRGAKARASAELDRAELAQSLQRPRLERELSILRSVYRASAEAMRTVAKNDSVEARHGSLHQLLKRGIISAPLVIELHRQMSDYTEKVHEQERQGVEALWQIYALEGRILKEELK